jgi:hypothetical protein
VQRFRPRLADRVNVRDDDDINHYVRVRTRVDNEGNIVSSRYGKAYGEIRCRFGHYGDTRLHVQFSYYLNPAENDRNVEFDTKRNLFKYPRSDFSNQDWRP